MFCEDPATTQSDEFFGIFDSFVSGFHEAKMDNDAVKRKREEEEKIAKQQQEVSCLDNKIGGVSINGVNTVWFIRDAGKF